MDLSVFTSSRGILLIACLACWLIQDSLSALEEQPLQLLPNGGFSFGFANRDRGAAFHEARGTPDKVVRGRFGSRSPANGRIEETVYTAGPRGFRPRGPNVARKYDLSQVRRGPIGRPGDPFYDPNEDPSYEFGFKTPTYQRHENADRNAKVTGHYSFIDDVGERHDVQYTAGKETGFHVGSLYPDSNPDAPEYRYFRGPLHKADKRTRGKASVQRGTDGSYRFISGGPDQRRSETKDPFGNVRGSYTFLDDKGKQHTTHYIAGPGIGYRVLKKSEEPHYPGFYPYRPFYPPLAGSTNIGGPGISGGFGGSFPSAPGLLPTEAAFGAGDDDDDKDLSTDDVFGAAASGHVKPTKFNNGDKKKNGSKPAGGNLFVGSTSSTDTDDGDIFGGLSSTSATSGSSFGSTSSSGGSGFSSTLSPGGDIFGGEGSSSSSGGIGISGAGDDDDDDIFGSGNKGGGANAGSSSSGKPSSTGFPRPTFPGSNSNGGNKQTGSSASGIGSASSTSGSAKPGSSAKPGTSDSGAGNGETDSSEDGIFDTKPGGLGGATTTNASKKPLIGSTASSQKPSQSSSNFGDDDDDDLFGPSTNVQVGIKKPSSTSSTSSGSSSSGQGSDDDDIFGGLGGGTQDKISTALKPPTATRPFSSGTGGGSKNQYLPMPTGSTSSSTKPTATSSTVFSSSKPQVSGGGSSIPVPTQTFGISSIPFPGQEIHHGTIFRNIGDRYIGFPPGVAVRAHVQSIDLFPISNPNPSPGEAMENGDLS